jgi:hypothetical protein
MVRAPIPKGRHRQARCNNRGFSLCVARSQHHGANVGWADCRHITGHLRTPIAREHGIEGWNLVRDTARPAAAHLRQNIEAVRAILSPLRLSKLSKKSVLDGNARSGKFWGTRTS